MLLSVLLAATPALATPPLVAPTEASEPFVPQSQEELLDRLAVDFGQTWGIINGEPAEKEDWPMTGGVVQHMTGTVMGFPFEMMSLICSSTLIAPDTVLLAAHCVDEEVIELQFTMYGYQVDDLELTYGFSRKKNLSDWSGTFYNLEWPNDVVMASKVVGHQDFDLLGMGMQLSENNDIALLFLEEPITDVDHAYVITEDEKDQVEVGQPVMVVGWGQQEEQPIPGTTGVKYMGESFINEKNKWEFQVGAVDADVRKCHGDSGGPSFMQVETDSAESWRIVGVTSHSYDFTDCAEVGGVDTNVGAFLDWIDEKMVNQCENGNRSWCETPGIVPPPHADGTPGWLEPEPEAPVAEAGLADEGGKGLGCSSAPVAAGWLAIAIGLVGVRRR